MSARAPRSAMLHTLTVRAREHDIMGRVELIGVAAEAMRDGRPVPREAALFVGGAFLAWLEHGHGGGDLGTKFLRVVRRHSRHTPQHLWRLIGDERTAARSVRTIAPTAEEPDDEAPQ